MQYSENLLCDPKELEGLDPAKTAHLCIDVQSFYFDPAFCVLPDRCAAKAFEVAENIAGLKTVFNRAGVARTFMVYHTEPPVHDFFIVKPSEEAGDIVLPKMGFSAFEATGLHKQLQDMGIKNLILSGGYTFCCVFETASQALDENYKVFVMADSVLSFDGIGIELLDVAGNGRNPWEAFIARSFSPKTQKKVQLTTGQAVLQALGYAPAAKPIL